MKSSKANRIPMFGRGGSILLLAAAAALGCAIVFSFSGCSTSPIKPDVPAGYGADTTPDRDGAELIGGAP